MKKRNKMNLSTRMESIIILEMMVSYIFFGLILFQ